jgi:hypothetical protein
MSDTETDTATRTADGFRDCEICSAPTRNSPIPLRHSTGEGTGVDDAVQLRACDDCQLNLANVAWGEIIDA